jgi:hypothetical protein
VVGNCSECPNSGDYHSGDPAYVIIKIPEKQYQELESQLQCINQLIEEDKKPDISNVKKGILSVRNTLDKVKSILEEYFS